MIRHYSYSLEQIESMETLRTDGKTELKIDDDKRGHRVLFMKEGYFGGVCNLVTVEYFSMRLDDWCLAKEYKAA